MIIMHLNVKIIYHFFFWLDKKITPLIKLFIG